MRAYLRNPEVSSGLRKTGLRKTPNHCRGPAGRYPRRMGFNPLRKQVKRTSDYVMLAAAFVVVALLLAWVIYPR